MMKKISANWKKKGKVMIEDCEISFTILGEQVSYKLENVEITRDVPVAVDPDKQVRTITGSGPVHLSIESQICDSVVVYNAI